jgi:hypothetical protein
MRKPHFLLALPVLLAQVGPVAGKHATHPVTPENIASQPYAFTVKVRDIPKSDKGKVMAGVKEFEIRMERKAGKQGPGAAARGDLSLAPIGDTAAPVPALTMVKTDGVITFTFQIPAKYVERASFTYTESSEGPFPHPGDYYVFDLKKFVSAKKAEK